MREEMLSWDTRGIRQRGVSMVNGKQERSGRGLHRS